MEFLQEHSQAIVLLIIAAAALYMFFSIRKNFSGESGSCGGCIEKETDVHTSATTGEELKTPFPMVGKNREP